MDANAAERLLSSLETAIQKLADPHGIALSGTDFRKFHACRDMCTTIEDMIDQNLIAPLHVQFSDLMNHVLDAAGANDWLGYEVRECSR